MARTSGVNSNILTITDAQLAQSGSYTVVVTNIYGAVTSIGRCGYCEPDSDYFDESGARCYESLRWHRARRLLILWMRRVSRRSIISGIRTLLPLAGRLRPRFRRRSRLHYRWDQ